MGVYSVYPLYRGRSTTALWSLLHLLHARHGPRGCGGFSRGPLEHGVAVFSAEQPRHALRGRDNVRHFGVVALVDPGAGQLAVRSERGDALDRLEAIAVRFSLVLQQELHH